MRTLTMFTQLAVVGLTLATTGCVIPRYNHVRTLQQTVETEPLTLIDVSTFNGAILVEPHELASVDMEVEFKGYGASEEAAESNCNLLDCDITAENGKLTIRATKPSDQWMAGATIKLKVPIDVSMKMHTSNGTVKAEYLNGEVDVHTSNGTVDMQHIYGSLTAKTSNGTVKVSDCQGPVNLSTSNGRVVYEGMPVGSENSIHTSNGTVTIKLPPHLTTEISARTSNGSVRCSLDTQRIIDEGKRKLHAIVGEGDPAAPAPKLTIKTSNGSIKVEPLEMPVVEVEQEQIPTPDPEVSESLQLSL